MNKPKAYNLTPARGQALLNFQGRIYPKSVELFETELIEEVRQKQKPAKKQDELNSDFRNLLIHGDCLSACAYLKSKNIKVDLVYIDPPFASGANYAKKIYLRNGGEEAIKSDDVSIGEELMYGDIWQKEDYLNWLYERLLAIRDVMSEKASIYVHLDWHIGHYVKLILDEIFGEENFINEIVWCYAGGGIPKRAYPRKHDVIYWYTLNSDEPNCAVIFNPQMRKYKPTGSGRRSSGEKYDLNAETPLNDWWDDIAPENTQAKTDTGYNTQKSEPLLERIIRTASDKGMIVADFFAGSGTTAKVANDLGRKFIGCDIGINAIQTTRDRLIKAGVNLDILKVKDGVRLFRNPAQTTAKIFSLIDGFKPKADLGLGEFWDGGIVDDKGEYIPVKFIEIHDRLTRELLDVLLEEIYQLQDVEGTISKAKVIYAHKDQDINQSYLNKAIKTAGKTNIAVELVSLDSLLGEKADKLFMPDNAEVEIAKAEGGYQVKIKRFFSPYLKTKIDEFNAKKIKPRQTKIQEQETPNTKITISDNGLELIESVQFDITLKKNGVWASNTDLEDKAGVKDKIKGIYLVPTNKFQMKIRNIAGDEIVIGSEELKLN